MSQFAITVTNANILSPGFTTPEKLPITVLLAALLTSTFTSLLLSDAL
ncbi:MAG: hypothetical protein R2728_16460 [Chitinophagales bacterium]